MENNNGGVLIIGLIIGALIGVFVSLTYFNDKPTPVVSTTICKEDSLQNVIIELQMDLKMQSDGFDSKEKRYSEILFEYEYGINHLKIYQPQSYREFHRILSHKEIFNRQDEQDNIKRLETPKW
jgi:gas vesicle protein